MTPTDPSKHGIDADARVRAQVRRANDLVADDEAPSPAVRAAVLAAAARQVHARPQAVGGRPRWRVPLAAAASVLVGTLAIVLASRTDVPSTQAVVTSETTAAVPAAPSAAASAPAPVPTPATTPSAPPPSAMAQREEAVPAPGRQQAAPPAAARAELAVPPGASDGASKVATPPPPVQAEARRQVAPARETAPVQAAPRAKDEAPASAGAVAAAPPAVLPAQERSSERSSERSTEMASNRVPPPPAAPAPPAQAQGAPAPKPAAPLAAPAAVAPTEQQVKARPVQRTAPMADAATPFPGAAPLSREEASRWITRIVELRRAGRDAEADAELKALRERAPTLTLPPEALPRAGTR